MMANNNITSSNPLAKCENENHESNIDDQKRNSRSLLVDLEWSFFLSSSSFSPISCCLFRKLHAIPAWFAGRLCLEAHNDMLVNQRNYHIVAWRGVRLSENKKSLERKELWAYLYELTSGKALTWLRIKKMDPASLSHSPGWTFPLRVVGKRMIFMKNKIGEYLLVGKLHRQPWCARWTNPEVKFNIWKHVGIIRILPLVNSLLKGTTTLPSSGLTIPSFLPCQWELVWFVHNNLSHCQWELVWFNSS